MKTKAKNAKAVEERSGSEGSRKGVDGGDPGRRTYAQTVRARVRHRRFRALARPIRTKVWINNQGGLWACADMNGADRRRPVRAYFDTLHPKSAGEARCLNRLPWAPCLLLVLIERRDALAQLAKLGVDLAHGVEVGVVGLLREVKLIKGRARVVHELVHVARR